MGRDTTLPRLLLGCILSSVFVESFGQYYGKEIGALSELHHGVRGRVYAIDSRTLFIRDFHYDGEGPTAYFYVGASKTVTAAGAWRLRDERGGATPLRRYRGEGVTLSLPEHKTFRDIRWFAVWCDEFAVNFGDVSIPAGLEYPRPVKAGALRGVHGVSSDPLVVVDAQTLLLPNFSYDGEAPDAKFWVGRGDKPSPQGIRIPDENGKEAPLRKYDRKTIVLTLPGELTVFDIGHFAVWCEAFTVNFGHVPLPRAQLKNIPPSLKMLGVSPQSKLNCEVLHDELAFEVRWAVAGDSIVLQLVAKLEDDEYMSFGLSGDARHSQMVGGDVAVAWLDKTTLKGYAVDYYLDAKSQCAGVRGSCPDERLGGEKTNSIKLLNAALVNGYSIVTYQRSLKAGDDLDLPVLTNASQPVIWALGPLNSRDEVSYHHHFTKGDKFIEFGRPPVWNCPMPEGEEDEHPMAPHREPAAPLREQVSLIKPNPVPTPKPVPRVTPWEIPAIQCYEPPDGVFYAQMGPTGGKQGYSAITGHVGWGISWYINGLLIPEINVVRGKKYTFVVEGGSNPEVPARYHPFYITNDPVGGYHHKTEQEKKGVEIYAGVRRARNGELQPTGVGRLCNWTPDNEGPEADEYRSFGAYQRSLTLVCDEGNPGVVTWTPDRNTPDTVYYQCFTHRHLGWKINVVDECDAVEGEESRVMERVVPPADLRAADSLQVLARAPPDNSLDHRAPAHTITNTKTNYDNFSSATGLMGEVYNDEPSQKDREIELVTNSQIKDVIQAVETMETKLKDDIKNNKPVQKPLGQYQVHEDVKEMFLPEQPVREDDEYTVETGKKPETYFLPANNNPLTLQSVLKPNGPKPAGNMRPPFRRPAPPEIKLRRPPPMFQKANNQGYPLPLPNPHGPHPMQKKQQKFNNVRMPPNMNRPMMHMIGPPPMKQTPALHNKPPGFNQQPGYNQKPGFNQQPGLNQQPDFKQQPGFNQQPDVKQQYEFNQKPGFNQQPGLNQHPDFKQQPSFNQQPDVKQQHEFNQKPGFNQQPAFNQPHQKPPPKLVGNSVQSIIMGKPMGSNILSGNPVKSQTLNLGFADIIANQVVKSQITLPGSIDVIAQHSSPPHVKHGQIILGKPMDNPVPLDQQMIHNNPFNMRQPPTPPPHIKTSTFRIKLNNEQSVHKEHQPHQDHPAQNEIVSSDFLGESTDSSTLTPAVNTGFKPDSIVVESGFKPIIREPLMAGEDKIANYNDREGSVNRREDTDVEESDYEESEQIITNHAYPSEHMTQSFEPMFIPSPEDHVIQTNHRTKEVFPSNHAKEDRPHPVYLKTETKINALFSKKNMEKDVPDMLMESDRVSPHYLPPDPKLPKEHSQKLSNQQTFTTYDGKTVSAATLTSVPDVNKTSTKIFSSKLPASSELLLKMPQFGPFKGEIPPPVAAHIATDPKLSSVSLNKTTKLKPVRSDSDLDDDDDDLGAAASEMLDLSDELEDEEEEEESKKRSRSKRESRSTQFERGEVEPVRTNGHSITRVAEPSAARSLSRTPHIVLLAILLNLF